MKNKKRFLVTLICMLCLLAFAPLQALAASTKASITLSASKATLEIGKTTTLTAEVTGKSQKVTWNSSNKKVATVSGGVVTAKKAGKVTITAKANGKTAKCVITVKQPDYRELYRKFLAQGKVKVNNTTITIGYFYILNINKKGVPELIITNKNDFSLVTYYVYSIVDGKVKYIGSCTAKGLSNSSFYYSKKYKGLYVGGWTNGNGGAWEALYCMNSTGKKIASKYWAKSQEYPKRYWTGTSSTKCKKVTQAKCTKYAKKYFSNLTICYMNANTAYNRSKI